MKKLEYRIPWSESTLSTLAMAMSTLKSKDTSEQAILRNIEQCIEAYVITRNDLSCFSNIQTSQLGRELNSLCRNGVISSESLGMLYMKLKHYFKNRMVKIDTRRDTASLITYVYVTVHYGHDDSRSMFLQYADEFIVDDPLVLFRGLSTHDPIREVDMVFIKEILDEALTLGHRDSA